MRQWYRDNFLYFPTETLADSDLLLNFMTHVLLEILSEQLKFYGFQFFVSSLTT